ncbi:MAG: RNA 2',3'-cyclic phosphodiesterase [Candidatus Izemoplasmatales bacterium]|jgi:2'-5' RNA ligase|nr:RNA 2',3'-cyclic phosphodiesterase [Candidatus Izemoplasmatales bacterium]MDD3865764.1 RNA 2',3'-cyclic phosphodiesterase [Candidatus Izemoplasmatales bacterium]
MRLFIAINFDDKTKTAFSKIIQSLKTISIKGNFTSTANLHLTLAFLGERNQVEVDAIYQAMHKISSRSIKLAFMRIGFFARNSSKTKLVWIGVEPNPDLNALFQDLKHVLASHAIFFEDIDFSPHITIGREIILQNDVESFDSTICFEPVSFQPDRISLMESKHQDGILFYHELGSKKL